MTISSRSTTSEQPTTWRSFPVKKRHMRLVPAPKPARPRAVTLSESEQADLHSLLWQMRALAMRLAPATDGLELESIATAISDLVLSGAAEASNTGLAIFRENPRPADEALARARFTLRRRLRQGMPQPNGNGFGE